jgi:phosphoenolpyruvate carboxykinase (GTP)
VLEWMLERVDGQVSAADSPLGHIPNSLNLEGLDLPDDHWDKLFEINREALLTEADGTQEYFESFGDRLPDAMLGQLERLRENLRYGA